MNDLVNKFLLAALIFMPEMHIKQRGFRLKTNKKLKNLCKQVIKIIFTRMILILFLI